MPVDQSIIDTFLLDEYYKYDLQKMLFQLNMTKRLPDSLRSESTIYSTKLNEYLSENDYYDVSTDNYLGEINDSGNSYFVYKLTETYLDTEYCYLGIVNKTKYTGRKIYNDVMAYTHHMEECNWDDWKEITKAHLEDFHEYAY